MQPIWVLVNCNSDKEAKAIGDKLLKARLGSCYDVFPRKVSRYFWPPKSGKLESAKGALLVVDTFESRYKAVFKFVKKVHSDKLPFIGYVRIHGVEPAYKDWMKGELK